MLCALLAGLSGSAAMAECTAQFQRDGANFEEINQDAIRAILFMPTSINLKTDVLPNKCNFIRQAESYSGIYRCGDRKYELNNNPFSFNNFLAIDKNGNKFQVVIRDWELGRKSPCQEVSPGIYSETYTYSAYGRVGTTKFEVYPLHEKTFTYRVQYPEF